jgi:hypothetical protein
MLYKSLPPDAEFRAARAGAQLRGIRHCIVQ